MAKVSKACGQRVLGHHRAPRRQVRMRPAGPEAMRRVRAASARAARGGIALPRDFIQGRARLAETRRHGAQARVAQGECARVASCPWAAGYPEPLNGARTASAGAERTLSCGPRVLPPCSRREAGDLSQRGHIRRQSASRTSWPPRKQLFTRTAPRARSLVRRCASRKHWAASDCARVQQLLLGSHRLASIGSAWRLCQSLWPSRCWHIAHCCLPFVIGASAFHTGRWAVISPIKCLHLTRQITAYASGPRLVVSLSLCLGASWIAGASRSLASAHSSPAAASGVVLFYVGTCT
jgi:hypothetical protein